MPLVNEGSLYTLNLTGIAGSPNAPAITRWTITWGDGSAAQTVFGNPPTVTHVYKDGPNTFTIQAAASDGIGTFTAGNTVGVMVMNVAPTLTISGLQSANHNALYSLHLSHTDPGADTIRSWTINWGDGSQPQVVSGNPSLATHRYTRAGIFTISVAATDEDGTYPGSNLLVVTLA